MKMIKSDVNTLFRFLSSKKGIDFLSGSHGIHTPQTLVKEILDQIPQLSNNKSVLVLFNLEFVISLVYTLEVNKENIIFYSDGENKTKFARRIGVNVITSLETSMKFDVVVGNPPYQDNIAKSSKKSWPKFVEKAIEITNEAGYIAMITPSTWMAGASSIWNIIKEKATFISTDESKHFSGIGSSFSYYILKNNGNSSSTYIKDFGEIDLSHMDMFPKNVDNISMSLSKKLTSNNYMSIEFDSFCHSQRTDKTSKVRSKEFRYPNKHGASTIIWSNVPHPCIYKKKVMFYMSGNPKPVYDSGNFGVTQHHGYIEVSSDAEGKNAVTYMSSKIVKFLISNGTFSQAWNKHLLKKIPAVDLSRCWSDTELYAHFGLTQEEIDYIETNVK